MKQLYSTLTPLLRSLYFTTLVMTTTKAFAEEELNQQTFSYPGGVAELTLEKQSDLLPEVKFGINEPVIIDQGDYWRILIGLSLDTLPGEYLVYIKRSVEDSSATHEKIQVRQKNYTLLEQNKKLKHTHQTHKSISEIEYQNTQQPSLPLSYPAEGNWNTSFGELSFNNKKQTLQSQNTVWLNVKNKLNIISPQNAIVSKIETNKDGISTLFLDHGRGLYSVISGLNDITVKIGNGVVAGAVIGNVSPSQKGQSLKKSYLSWQSIMNGEYINPIILTQL